MLVVLVVAADSDGTGGMAEGASRERTACALVVEFVASVAEVVGECGDAACAEQLAV